MTEERLEKEKEEEKINKTNIRIFDFEDLLDFLFVCKYLENSKAQKKKKLILHLQNLLMTLYFRGLRFSPNIYRGVVVTPLNH